VNPALLFLIAVLLAGCAQAPSVGAEMAEQQHEQEHDHNHDQRAPLPAGSSLAIRCRSGAFVEASSIINSVVEIAAALPEDTDARTRRELDSVLYTALKQARSEVECVQGGLRHGYQHAYALVIRRGGALALERGLSADIATMAEETAKLLEANEAVE